MGDVKPDPDGSPAGPMLGFSGSGRIMDPYLPGSSWRVWVKQFEIGCSLARVSDKRVQGLLFLRCVGDSCYVLLESLLQGKDLTDVSYDELKGTLDAHFTPKQLKWAERYKMRQLIQEPGETLQTFFARLQKAVAGCGYDAKELSHRDESVVLQFIVGIRSVETRRRLLEKEVLTTKSALELAVAFETAGEGAVNLDRKGPVGIGRVITLGKDYSKVECYSCGELGHVRRDCRNKARKKEQGPGRSRNGTSGRWRRNNGTVDHCEESSDSELEDDYGMVNSVSCQESVGSVCTPKGVITDPSCGSCGNAPRKRGVAWTPRSRGVVIPDPSCGTGDLSVPPRSRGESPTPRSRGVVCPCLFVSNVIVRDSAPQCGGEAETPCAQGAVATGPSCGSVGNVKALRSRSVAETPRSGGLVESPGYHGSVDGEEDVLGTVLPGCHGIVDGTPGYHGSVDGKEDVLGTVWPGYHGIVDGTPGYHGSVDGEEDVLGTVLPGCHGIVDGTPGYHGSVDGKEDVLGTVWPGYHGIVDGTPGYHGSVDGEEDVLGTVLPGCHGIVDGTPGYHGSVDGEEDVLGTVLPGYHGIVDGTPGYHCDVDGKHGNDGFVGKTPGYHGNVDGGMCVCETEVPGYHREVDGKTPGDPGFGDGEKFLSNTQFEPAVMLSMEMNSVGVRCELDTGAACSIMDTRTWDLIGRPELKPANITARAFDGEMVPLLGRCTVTARFAGVEATVEVHVGKTARHSVCGRDMIHDLRIDKLIK